MDLDDDDPENCSCRNPCCCCRNRTGACIVAGLCLLSELGLTALCVLTIAIPEEASLNQVSIPNTTVVPAGGTPTQQAPTAPTNNGTHLPGLDKLFYLSICFSMQFGIMAILSLLIFCIRRKWFVMVWLGSRGIFILSIIVYYALFYTYNLEVANGRRNEGQAAEKMTTPEPPALPLLSYGLPALFFRLVWEPWFIWVMAAYLPYSQNMINRPEVEKQHSVSYYPGVFMFDHDPALDSHSGYIGASGRPSEADQEPYPDP